MQKPADRRPRTSLLRRRDAIADEEQPLVANVDIVLVVCGLDRPVKPGRVDATSASRRQYFRMRKRCGPVSRERCSTRMCGMLAFVSS